MSKISFNEFTSTHRAPRWKLTVKNPDFPVIPETGSVKIDFFAIIKNDFAEDFEINNISQARSSRMEAVTHYAESQRVAWNILSGKTGVRWATKLDDKGVMTIMLKSTADRMAADKAIAMATEATERKAAKVAARQAKAAQALVAKAETKAAKVAARQATKRENLLAQLAELDANDVTTAA